MIPPGSIPGQSRPSAEELSRRHAEQRSRAAFAPGWSLEPLDFERDLDRFAHLELGRMTIAATTGGTRSDPAFAHASEAEFARILDFYRVRWEYEPHVFPILWDLDGTVLESFAPDFYLPDLDLYVEMTTLQQRLVRKKNRKVRRLRELYPDARIKLFYARDFRALMLKYGRFALVEELTGAPGPAHDPRAAVPVQGTVAASAGPATEAARAARAVMGDEPEPEPAPAERRSRSGRSVRRRRARARGHAALRSRREARASDGG